MRDLDALLNEVEIHERYLEAGEGEDEIATPKFGDEQSTSQDITVLAGMLQSSVYMASNITKIMLGPSQQEKVKTFMGDSDFSRLKEMAQSLDEMNKFCSAYQDMGGDSDEDEEETPDDEEGSDEEPEENSPEESEEVTAPGSEEPAEAIEVGEPIQETSIEA